jgi:hypothetical protein
MRFLKFFSGLLDRLFLLIGAFIGSQVPEFMQQYRQRLSGHEAELNQLVDKLTQMASLSGKTLDQYIEKFMINADLDFAAQGTFMQGVVARWHDLHQTLQALAESSMWERPFYFFKYLNYPIAESTIQSFQPGINLTIEGLCYTGLGMGMAYLIYAMVVKLVLFIYRKLATLFGGSKKGSPETPQSIESKS